MAIHALWEDRYGISLRKGPLDLSDQTTGSTSTANQDAVSHTNAGVPTNNTVSSKQRGGKGHFYGGGADLDQGTDKVGATIGQRIATGTGANSFCYGLAVTGNPDFSTGQEMIEIDVQDGFTTPRMNTGTTDATSGSSSIFRGVQTPTGSVDFIPTSKSLMSVGASFFQSGATEKTSELHQKQLTTPIVGDGSSPLYYATLVRQISKSGADSRLLSDAVCNSFSLSCDQSTPLTCSAGYTGRLLVTNYDMSTDIDGSGRTPNVTLDDGRNYLLQDCQCTITTASGSNILMPIESFNIDCTSDVSYSYFNSQFPINMVIGGYTIDGSVTIPGEGRGGNHNLNALQEVFAKAGAGTGTGSALLTPVQINFFWQATRFNSSGTPILPGTSVTLPTDVAAVRDLHIRINGVISDVTTGGDNELTTTISFSGRNSFDSSGDLDKKAISIDMLDDLTDTTWGYDNKADTYHTGSGFY